MSNLPSLPPRICLAGSPACPSFIHFTFGPRFPLLLPLFISATLEEAGNERASEHVSGGGRGRTCFQAGQSDPVLVADAQRDGVTWWLWAQVLQLATAVSLGKWCHCGPYLSNEDSNNAHIAGRLGAGLRVVGNLVQLLLFPMTVVWRVPIIIVTSFNCHPSDGNKIQ